MKLERGKKKGAFSNEEKELVIEAVAADVPVSEIAERLNRSEDSVVKLIGILQSKVGDVVAPVKPTDAERSFIRHELRSSKVWKNLRDEFTRDELDYFEECYVKLMSQLKDVLASEETQVFQAIKFQILMSRNLKGRKRLVDEIDRLESEYEKIISEFGTPVGLPDEAQEKIREIHYMLDAAREKEVARTNEYAKLQERHDALMKGLKAQRDQRVQEFEKQGEDLLSVIRMLNKRDVQQREGRHMELVKMAGIAAHKRLGEPIKYEDGNYDRPILSADTVGTGEENVQPGPDVRLSDKPY